MSFSDTFNGYNKFSVSLFVVLCSSLSACISKTYRQICDEVFDFF